VKDSSLFQIGTLVLIVERQGTGLFRRKLERQFCVLRRGTTQTFRRVNISPEELESGALSRQNAEKAAVALVGNGVVVLNNGVSVGPAIKTTLE
jgi:hypothetical protein